MLKKLDDVLECLFNISGDNPNFVKIENWLTANNRNVHTGDIQDCLLYLYNEGYIYCEVDGDRTHKYSDWSEAHYLINVKGKHLYETTNGFVNKAKKEAPKWHQKHPILYALISAIGGAIISISVGLILWQVDKQSKNQENQEIKQSIKDANHRLDSLTSILTHIPDSLKR